MINKYLKLILVTNKSSYDAKDYMVFIKKCVSVGITAVQLREKNLYGENLLKFGLILKTFLDKKSIPLIVNDDLELCMKLKAAGLHLGQNDGDTQYARKMLGSNKIIGLSINTMEELKLANNLDINYIGLGAIFPTKNKSNIQTIWGLDGLKNAHINSRHPIVAIGGINENNAQSVMNSGASGIAAIDAFHATKTLKITIKKLKKIVDE